jgi:hypothetical protein
MICVEEAFYRCIEELKCGMDRTRRIITKGQEEGKFALQAARSRGCESCSVHPEFALAAKSAWLQGDEFNT